MPPATNSRNRSDAADAKRVTKSYTGLTSVAATGVITLAAGGFLDSLQAGDACRFSALTGGSGLTPGTTYYIVGALRWPLGQTTFQVAATPFGAPITAGTNITVGTISTGLLSPADDGQLSSNYVSPDSPAGR